MNHGMYYIPNLQINNSIKSRYIYGKLDQLIMDINIDGLLNNSKFYKKISLELQNDLYTKPLYLTFEVPIYYRFMNLVPFITVIVIIIIFFFVIKKIKYNNSKNLQNK